MRIDILTILPKLFDGPFSDSILKRAQEKGHVSIHLHNIRDYSTDKHKNVDDYQYGGGAGMVMRIEPIAACIEQLKEERTYDEIIYMTPDGELLEQGTSNQLSIKGNLMILCGHYKGVDQRVRDLHITKEVSIGDYVLSGGELAAAVVVGMYSLGFWLDWPVTSSSCTPWNTTDCPLVSIVILTSTCVLDSVAPVTS